MYFWSVIPDLHKMKLEISSMSMEQGVFLSRKICNFALQKRS